MNLAGVRFTVEIPKMTFNEAVDRVTRLTRDMASESPTTLEQKKGYYEQTLREIFKNTSVEQTDGLARSTTVLYSGGSLLSWEQALSL